MKLHQLLYSIPVLILNACADSPDKTATLPVVQKSTKPAIEEPFKFHKMLEVAPGNYYDVFSWGRGTKDGGQYMILRSDSSDQQYNSVSGDLEGPIKQALNADMDTDGNPEIIIYAQSIDTNRYTNVFIYEYNNDNARKLDFPRLTDSQRKGYRGDDNFYIKESKLIREFPIFSGRGKEATNTGAKRVLQYSLQSNSLSVKQLSKDSTNVTADKPVVTTQETKSEKKTAMSKSSKKHHTETKKHTATKKRKKHRR